MATVTVNQECGICGVKVPSKNELSKPIKIKHTETLTAKIVIFKDYQI